jgi:hypothetical protein
VKISSGVAKAGPLASLQQAPQPSTHRHNGSFLLVPKPVVLLSFGVAPGTFAFFNFPFWGDRRAAKITLLKQGKEMAGDIFED